MSSRIIACGGTGQHGALAYLRLCVLCRDFFPLGSPGDKFLPYIYVFDKDKGGKGGSSEKTAAELLSELAAYLNCYFSFIDPTPLLGTADNQTTTFSALFEGSELLEILFNQEQRGVLFRQGNFGHPAVGATVFLAKLRDTELKDDTEANVDTEYASLERQIRGAANQRIAHIGSTVGGTGSGVMPTLAGRLASLHSDNYHIVVPFLEWFSLTGRDEETRAQAEKRNKIMRQNRSSGLLFYLHSLQDRAAVLPLGYADANKEKYQREWDGNFNQKAKEAAIHLAAALALWEFFYAPTPVERGMYAFTPNDHNEIPGISKIGDTTLSSLLAANLTLIQEAKWVCDYLRKPLDTRNVLLESNIQKVTVPVLRNLSSVEMAGIAQELQGVIDWKENCCSWLSSLEDVDSSLRASAVSKEIPVGFLNVQSLFPDINVNRSGGLGGAIYNHLVQRASNVLQKIAGLSRAITANRILPEYAVEGVTPPPRLQGQMWSIDDSQHITQLWTPRDISAQSIPSPLGITRYLNEVCLAEEKSCDEEAKKWFEKYVLLLKALVSGVIEFEKVLLTKDRKTVYDLNKIIKDLPVGEDNSWKDVTEFFRLKFVTSTRECMMGASSPATFVVPSMSAKEEDWEALRQKIDGARDNEARKLLAAWCKEINKWDRTINRRRPRWFQAIQTEFSGATGMDRGFSWLDKQFQVVWDNNLLELPVPKIEFVPVARDADWDRIAKKFGVKTYHYKGESLLYQDMDHVKVADDLEDELRSELVNLCQKVVTGNAVCKDYLLFSSNDTLDARPFTIVWVDLKDFELSNTKLSTDDGVISLIHERIRIVFDKDSFCGITPATISTRKIAVFEGEQDKPKYPDLPIKMKYAALVGETARLEPTRTIGENLEYSIQMRGRPNPIKITVPVDKTSSASGAKGTAILWPNFALQGWNAYYFYRDGDTSFRELDMRLLLTNQDQEGVPWDISRNIPLGESVAVTLAVDAAGGQEDPLERHSWKNERPKYVALSKNGEDLGLLKISLNEVRNFLPNDSETWGIDFGTSGSLVAFYNGTVRNCLEIKNDYTHVILSSATGRDEPDWKEDLRKDGKWFPTFPGGRPDRNVFVLSELVFSKADFNLNRLRSYFPGQDFHLVSSHIAPELLTRNKLFGKLKWEFGRDDSYLRPARKGFLALLLLLACADRLNIRDVSSVGNIRPSIAFPLRMGKAGKERLEEDFKRAFKWVTNATGLRFEKLRFVSESTAAASSAAPADEVIIADLGGATLDLWMGKPGNIYEDPNNFSADSIRFGGFDLLNYLVNHFPDDIRRVAGAISGDLAVLEIQLQREILERSRDEIRDRFRRFGSPEFKKVQTGFFALLTEYISRFIASRIQEHYKEEEGQCVVQLKTIGNGWKLNFSIDSSSTITTYVAEKVAARLQALLPHKNIKISPVPGGEKEEIAIGAATYSIENVPEQTDVKTYCGIDCTKPPSLTWTTLVPFELGHAAGIGQSCVEVSAVAEQVGKEFTHPILPSIPSYPVKNKVYGDFMNKLRDAGDNTVYDLRNDLLYLLVSPFGLLLERLSKSLSDFDAQ